MIPHAFPSHESIHVVYALGSNIPQVTECVSHDPVEFRQDVRRTHTPHMSTSLFCDHRDPDTSRVTPGMDGVGQQPGSQ